MKQEIIDKLLLHAKKKLLHDNEDACVYDYSGGNVDDAYEIGERDGYTEFARELLTDLGLTYENQ